MPGPQPHIQDRGPFTAAERSAERPLSRRLLPGAWSLLTESRTRSKALTPAAFILKLFVDFDAPPTLEPLESSRSI